MLSDSFNGKCIGILGYKSIIGKVLIKKIMMNLSKEITSIYLFSVQQSLSSFETQIEENFKQDFYLKVLDIWKLGKKINFVNIKSAEIQNISLDVLYNCLIPADYTRSSIQRCLELHIWKSMDICLYLKKLKKIDKIVMASSLYCQPPGYISQNSKIQLNKLIGFNSNPDQIKRQKLLEDLKDIFQNDRQIWEWSINEMETLFAKQTRVSKIQIIRLPCIGPTLINYQGYSTSFNSVLSLIYEIGNGFLDTLQGNLSNIIDIVPADYAVNYMIAVSAINPSPLVSNNENQYTIKQENTINQDINMSNLSIHNLSSSSRNPISLGKFTQYVSQGWSQISQKKVNFRIRQKKWQRKIYSIQNNLPREAKNRMAVLLDIKPWKIQSQQAQLNMLKKRQIMTKYRYYLQKQWICESNKSIDYFFSMDQSDQINFNFNVNSINWKTYAKLCCYSVQKYLMGLQIQKFTPSNLDLLHLQNSSYFSDIIWAISEGKNINTQTSQQMKNYILSTKSVKDAIKQLVQQQTGKLQQTPMSYQKVQEQYYKVADQMCDQMFSQYSMGSIRGFAWFLHKVFRTIYQKVVIDKQSFTKLKSYDESTNGPLIIIPTHRSYIDFLIMSYVFFSYGIKCPHIAAAQDFLNMAVVHILLRKSGAFFIKRNMRKNRVLYKAIMNEYISKLLGENQYLQFFIEGTRSRSGKMLTPKYGILSIVAKNVLDGKIPDAQILPVTLNYQKVLQGASFTYQMMGQSKVKQSLSRLIKAVDVLKQNYGRIYVQFCEQISVKKYFKQNLPKYANKKDQFQLILTNMGYDIVYSMTSKLVITPPAVLSSIILMHRIGISDQRLSQKVNWLCKQLSQRGVKIARTQADSSISVTNTLALMDQVVNKSKKDMFQVQVTFDQFSFTQLFTLTMYRNTLTHIFFQEAIIAIAITSFGHQNMITGNINKPSLFSDIFFLRNILRKQYVLEHYLENEQRIQYVVKYMQERGVLTKNQRGQICVQQPQSDLFNFYCSLVWPLIQSYWITCLYLFKLQKDNLILQMPKLQSQIQWFGQSLFTERVILHLEAISMDTLKNSTSLLTDIKFLGQTKESGKAGYKVISEIQKIKEYEEKISKFLKSKYAASVKGILKAGRGSVTLDFPFLSKL